MSLIYKNCIRKVTVLYVLKAKKIKKKNTKPNYFKFYSCQINTLLINEKEKVGIVITYYFAWVFSIKNGFWTERKEIRSKEVEKFI